MQPGLTDIPIPVDIRTASVCQSIDYQRNTPHLILDNQTLTHRSDTPHDIITQRMYTGNLSGDEGW
jgi:hypothetical protein